MSLLRVVAPHFVAGVVYDNERCVVAAPILKYAYRMSRSVFLAYCKAKRWQVEIL